MEERINRSVIFKWVTDLVCFRYERTANGFELSKEQSVIADNFLKEHPDVPLNSK